MITAVNEKPIAEENEAAVEAIRSRIAESITSHLGGEEYKISPRNRSVFLQPSLLSNDVFSNDSLRKSL
jgi:hypothetical protein